MSEKHTIRLPGILLDEIQAKEEKGEYLGKRSRRSTKNPNKRVSRKDARKEERSIKKQKRFGSNKQGINNFDTQLKPILSSKKETPQAKKPALKKSTSSNVVKSVKIDESLNVTKNIQRSYKKSDFYQADESNDEDSDHDLSDDNDEDLEAEITELYSGKQPQTADEVMRELKNKKQFSTSIKNKKSADQCGKKKTAKDIMYELSSGNADESGEVSDDFSSDEDLEDELNELYGNKNQPQTEEEVFSALRAAKMNNKNNANGNFTKQVTKPMNKKTAKEIMEELNAGNMNEKEYSGVDDESDFSDDEDLEDELNDLYGNQNQPQTEDEVFAALKNAKLNKRDNSTKKVIKSSKTKTAKEILEELNSKREEMEDDEDNSSDFSSDEDLDEELEELYGNKDQLQTEKEVFAALKAAKSKKSDNRTNKKEKKFEEKILKIPTFLEDESATRDEQDMIHYAKKLGLKDGKLSKMDDDDLVGGLLDGLDFMDGYGLSNNNDDDPNDDHNDAKMGDESNNYNEYGEEPMKQLKENPYIAPVTYSTEKAESTSRYIPPALRKLQVSEDEQNKLRVKRIIKGQLNKLSEVNIIVIANEINALYYDNPRNLINETLTNIILESIYLQNKLLDSFVILHAALVAAVYRLQGVEFLGFFTQTLMEKYESFYSKNIKDQQKESSNLLSILTYCYAFNVINCNLIYDIINSLIKGFSEFNSELLLRLVKNAGNQLRTDDPSALKEIVSLLHQEIDNKILSSRSQFLVDSIVDLRNNKTKKHNEISENNHQLIIKMKKYLGSINANKAHDPLTITLDDIHNIDKRGKWWLTGSAWKGKAVESNQSKDANGLGEIEDSAFEHLEKEAFESEFGSEEPNWVELAKKYRINNDIRRAIFISIMSSEDYIDAFTKLDKLQLKKAQSREIPTILLHCQQLEPSFNKFYGLLAVKLCSEHMYRKTFQFCLWNFIKDINNENDDSDDEEEDIFKSRITSNDGESEDIKLQKLVNSAKIYGFLMGNGALQLNLFRIVNFLTINEDSRLFLEVLFITFFEEIIKKSKTSFDSIKKDDKKNAVEFDQSILNERFEKIEDPVLLRGIKIFLLKNVKNSSFLKKKYTKSINWAIGLISKE